MKTYNNIFDKIISLDNLFLAWDEFKKGKQKKFDVMKFELSLEQNIFQLHRELKQHTYGHSPYSSFFINDPKCRHIHKAMVRDRILHHAVFSVINSIFEPTFTPTSFSCRVGLGAHKGVEVLGSLARAVAKNGTRQCFALKCDIQKFFDSVDHKILLPIIKKKIKDENTIWLLRSIIKSYASTNSRERERVEPAGAKKEYLSAILPLNFLRISI